LSPAGSYLTLFPQRWCGLLGRCERQFPGSFELRIAVRLLCVPSPQCRLSLDFPSLPDTVCRFLYPAPGKLSELSEATCR
jgi:hypothetical protein